MSDLLTLAVKAHGGLDRWNTLKTVKMQAAITGGIWYVKGRPDVLKDVIMEAENQIEKLVTTFPGQDKKSVFEPDVTLGIYAGSVGAGRPPRLSFPLSGKRLLRTSSWFPSRRRGKLVGKVAVVTGASKGIGAANCQSACGGGCFGSRQLRIQ